LSQRLSRIALPDLLFTAALLFAFVHALQTTSDLTFGYNPDMYRDTGVAETMLNGTFPADPLYQGELSWYNPLVPGTIAILSQITGQPPHLVYVRAGAYLNLLAPVGFYILASCLFNRWTGLACAVSYLFLVENRAIGYFASYSPWLFPTDFAQGLFYLSLAAYWKALKSQRIHWYLGFGALWGVAFLAHTSPALLLGGIFVLSGLPRLYAVWDETLQSERLYRQFGSLMAALVPALIVSLPLLTIIVGHYGLRTLNDDPATFRSPQLDVSNITTLLSAQVSVWTLGAALGFLHLLRLRSVPLTRQLLLLWLFVVVLLLGYDYGVQLLARLGVNLPVIIPSWHLMVYFEAVKALLFGLGLVVSLKLLAGIGQRLLPRLMLTERLQHPAMLVGVLLLLVVAMYPAYRTRYVFAEAREEALRTTQVMTDRTGAFEWVQQNTIPDDVFLTTDLHLSMFVVAQAGRKLVAAPPTFSNPYVEFEPRVQDQEAMIDALLTGDEQRFKDLGEAYDVEYVVAAGEVLDALTVAEPTQLEPMYTEGDVAIYRVRPGAMG
jgi:hypothetical protein